MTLEELRTKHGSRGFTRLEEIDVSPSVPCVVLFHTPHHKFCVLMCSKDAVLLHSNQDIFHGCRSSSFTFEEYLKKGPVRFDTPESLKCFFSDMKLAVKEPIHCQYVFDRHFGIPFRKGPEEEYWFTVVECIPFDEEHQHR